MALIHAYSRNRGTNEPKVAGLCILLQTSNIHGRVAHRVLASEVKNSPQLRDLKRPRSIFFPSSYIQKPSMAVFVRSLPDFAGMTIILPSHEHSRPPNQRNPLRQNPCCRVGTRPAETHRPAHTPRQIRTFISRPSPGNPQRLAEGDSGGFESPG